MSQALVSQKTMKAHVLAAPRRFEQCDVAVPEPGKGEVRVRVSG